MDPFVLAIREDIGGMFMGFNEDHQVLRCSQCGQSPEYRLRYTTDQQENIVAHRCTAQRLIEAEHPKHSYQIRVC